MKEAGTLALWLPSCRWNVVKSSRTVLFPETSYAGETGVESYGPEFVLSSHAFVVREQHALHVPHGLAAPHADLGGEGFGTGEPVQGDQAAAGPASLPADAFRVTGQGERLLQLGPRHHRAAALPAQPSLQQQLTQRLADGLAGDLEPRRQIPLGRQQSALAELVDQLGDACLDGVVLGDASVLRLPERTGAPGAWSFG